jgi:hypothetical protein
MNGIGDFGRYLLIGSVASISPPQRASAGAAGGIAKVPFQ